MDETKVDVIREFCGDEAVAGYFLVSVMSSLKAWVERGQVSDLESANAHLCCLVQMMRDRRDEG